MSMVHEEYYVHSREVSMGSGSLLNSRRKAFARNVKFCFIVSGSERTYYFRVLK